MPLPGYGFRMEVIDVSSERFGAKQTASHCSRMGGSDMVLVSWSHLVPKVSSVSRKNSKAGRINVVLPWAIVLEP